MYIKMMIPMEESTQKSIFIHPYIWYDSIYVK